MLLKVYFKSSSLRAAALKAAAEIHGEDGWAINEINADLTPDLDFCRFPASINCVDKTDAVKTWAGLNISFVELFGEILERSEAFPEFQDV